MMAGILHPTINATINVAPNFRYLDQAGYIERQQEWPGGQLQARLGLA